MKKDYLDYIKFTNEFLELSGDILKKKFNQSLLINIKNDKSFVTEVDTEIENIFREKVKKEFPSHGIIGEEFGEYNNNSDLKWIIDPLDGTHSFISGKPLFGTLISLTEKNNVCLGVIDIPVLNERWIGSRSTKVLKNGKVCDYVTENKEIEECIISSTSPLMFNDKIFEEVRKIYRLAKLPIFGTDCYGYGLLLSGKIDLIIEANLKPWDYMAQICLIEEIGGLITDWNGNKLGLKSDGKVIASRSKKAHKQIINFLGG